MLFLKRDGVTDCRLSRRSIRVPGTTWQSRSDTPDGHSRQAAKHCSPQNKWFPAESVANARPASNMQERRLCPSSSSKLRPASTKRRRSGTRHRCGRPAHHNQHYVPRSVRRFEKTQLLPPLVQSMSPHHRDDPKNLARHDASPL